MNRCKICENAFNLDYFQATERMLETGDIFTYFICPKCKCIQIENENIDLTKYYNNYYSLSPSIPIKYFKIFKTFKNHLSIRHITPNIQIFGKSTRNVNLWNYSPYLNTKKIKILDVGCGTGAMIREIHDLGFHNICGIDPNIEQNIYYKGSCIVRKGDVYDINDEFDLIMLNHSLEHMRSPHAIFKHIQQLLNPTGLCIIRTPITPSLAWLFYRENWVQLDAPRHLYIHSFDSLKLLAENNRMHVVQRFYDSTEFQFLGSEQYLKGISLNSERSYKRTTKRSIFTKQDIKFYSRLSVQLNGMAFGDQIFLVLQKDSSQKRST